jgi:hypothetical protein
VKSMTVIERALVTKELGKAQAALWTAFTIAARANDLDLANILRKKHRALGTAIISLNGGPVVTVKEILP